MSLDEVEVLDARGGTVRLRPGVLDADADYAFKNGQCLAMAYAIARDRGWGVAVATYYDDHVGSLVRHAWASGPDGAFYDVRGEHDPVIVEEELDPDEEIETYRPEEIDLALEDHRDGMNRQDVETAALFVPAVLERAKSGELDPDDLW